MGSMRITETGAARLRLVEAQLANLEAQNINLSANLEASHAQANSSATRLKRCAGESSQLSSKSKAVV